MLFREEELDGGAPFAPSPIERSFTSWRPHHVQVGIRRGCPHNVGSGRLVRSRKSRGFGIKGPHDHPMGTNLNGRTCRVMRIRVTSLCSASQHVNDARGTVGRFCLMLQEIAGPLHRRLVCTHRRPSDLFGISRHAGKAVRSLPKNFYDPTLTIYFRYLSLPGYVRGCGQQGSSYFGLRRFVGAGG